jgi:hypothetical protein
MLAFARCQPQSKASAGQTTMFPVEISITDENALAERMTTVQQWLDDRQFEPLTFRYSFVSSAILFRVDFAKVAEAAAFAMAFDGKIIAY